QLAAVLRDAEIAAEKRLRRSRAEADDDARLDGGELCLEPGPAGDALRPARLLVDPALPARLPLEVLDGVRDVGLRPVDARLLERPVEQLAGRPDERLAREILLVSRLLADEQHLGVSGALAEDGLRRVPVEVAPAAALHRLAEGGEGLPRREERGRGHGRAIPGAADTIPLHWRLGREVRQRPAKPRTAVRIRQAPPRIDPFPARSAALPGVPARRCPPEERRPGRSSRRRPPGRRRAGRRGGTRPTGRRPEGRPRRRARARRPAACPRVGADRASAISPAWARCRRSGEPETQASVAWRRR